MSDIDMDRIANTLFSETTPTNKAVAPQRQVTIDDQRAARFFNKPIPRLTQQPQSDEDAEEPKSEEELAAVLYENSPVFGDASRAMVNVMVENLEDPAEAAAIAEDWTGPDGVFHRIGLSATDGAAMAQLGVSVHVGGVTDEQFEQWGEEAKAVLLQDHGKGAHQALQDARAFIAKHAQLYDYLDRTGLGSHPQVVRLAARLATQARRTGKL